ncbi:hypothetical protein [Streptomyces sp. NPDC094032]|uniref:hypothetical protein n=1 Tax=Streptomyces sp. NPDC094032 TaxID=3155308 RepID=UPI00331CBC26
MTKLTVGSLLTDTLADLRDELGAAVYISSHTDGEIVIQEAPSSAPAPAVNEQTPFGLTAHANAVGKSLLAQQNFTSRMDHLSRYPCLQLPDRTITDERPLFHHIDFDDPHAAQFALLEYADTPTCASPTPSACPTAHPPAWHFPVAPCARHAKDGEGPFLGEGTYCGQCPAQHAGVRVR